MQILDCFFSVVTDGWVLIRTKPVWVYRRLWSDNWIGMINLFVELKLVSRHTKVQASALQTFAKIFVDNNFVITVSLHNLKYSSYSLIRDSLNRTLTYLDSFSQKKILKQFNINHKHFCLVKIFNLLIINKLHIY